MDKEDPVKTSAEYEAASAWKPTPTARKIISFVERHDGKPCSKAQIAVEKENALRDIRNTVADVSVQIAEKVVRRQLDKDTEDEQYIERLLNEVTRQK